MAQAARNSWGSGLLNKIAIGAAAIGVAGYCLNSSMYTVGGGERALIFDKTRNGTRDFVVKPGTHFLIPFLQYPIIYDVRTTPFQFRSGDNAQSKDLQRVLVTLRVLYRPVKSKLPTIYRRLGLEYHTVWNSFGVEVLKAVVANYDASELISRRELVSNEIRMQLAKRAEEFDILLDDVAITHLSFTNDFIHAVEQKQVAHQLAEQAKFVVAKNEQEKLAKIIMAEGESEAARLIAEAMASGPGYLALRKIEALRDIVEELSQSRNVVYVPSNTNILMSMPAH
eukprot:TRINITY_DN765_c0_g1_i1.p1 TRINITY_DN765_c0_g1~~TRINITY_DN765_c0_g1_i1.p1  ORF type:complete len:290 (+),score=55.27 TRINITY_DN765_c0_g1_i1:23-871(+)